MPLSDLKLWLKADAGVVLSGSSGNAGVWFDQTTNHFDATQPTANLQPILVTDALNGKPAVRFYGTNYFSIPNLLNGTTQAEVYVVLKATADVPAAQKGLWRMGGNGDGTLAYPNTSGNIVDNFGSTLTRTVGNPAQPLDQYHLYNVAGATNDWSARINGALQSSTTVNTYGFWTGTWRLGSSSSYQFAGDIAEVLVFSKMLNVDEQEVVGTYLNTKYNFVNIPTGSIQLSAQTLSSSQIALSWNQQNATNGSLYVYTVERRIGTNGAFQTIAQIAGDTRFFDQGLPAQTTYSYRVRNTFIPAADPSNEAIVTTIGLFVQTQRVGLVALIRIHRPKPPCVGVEVRSNGTTACQSG